MMLTPLNTPRWFAITRSHMFTDNDFFWKNQVDLWKSVAQRFADACELDGFGDVRTVKTTDMTIAYKEYEKAMQGE